MRFTKLSACFLAILFGTQILSASEELGKNNILQFQIKKDNKIIAAEYAFFYNDMGRSSGNRQGLLHYKCTKNADKTIETIGSEMYGVDNYRELKCAVNTNGDADCELKIYNAKNHDQEAIKEYKAKSCKAVSPEVITNEFKFTLKKNSTSDIKLSDGYSFLYSFQEEK